MSLMIWFPLLEDSMSRRTINVVHQHRAKAGIRLHVSACALWDLRCAVLSSGLSYVMSKMEADC